MATAAAAAAQSQGRPRLAAAALFAVSAIALLYLVFLFQLFNDPSLRALGFGGASEIQKISYLVLALLIVVMIVIWMRWVPAQAAAAQPAAQAAVEAARGQGAQPAGRVRGGAFDAGSRPGAPLRWVVPAVPPDLLDNGWRRYPFPAERTGGVCIDTDIVVDAHAGAAPAGEVAPRGRFILRVRDEVARVCVRCDLIDHCHGKVAALITREEMLANHECVPGLKQIATRKIEAMRAAPAAQGPAQAPPDDVAQPAHDGAPPPAMEVGAGDPPAETKSD